MKTKAKRGMLELIALWELNRNRRPCLVPVLTQTAKPSLRGVIHPCQRRD